MKYFYCTCPCCGFEFGFTVPSHDEDDKDLINELAECPCGAQCNIKTTGLEE